VFVHVYDSCSAFSTQYLANNGVVVVVVVDLAFLSNFLDNIIGSRDYQFRVELYRKSRRLVQCFKDIIRQT